MFIKKRLKGLIIASLSIFMLSSITLYGYQWPLFPFNQQHKVTGVLDECRGDRDHFHDGIDIGNAPQGTYVYAVDDGTAYRGGTGNNTYIRLETATQTFFGVSIYKTELLIARLCQRVTHWDKQIA